MSRRSYTGGEYAQRNPGWHAEDSIWKARQVMKMLARHRLAPRTVCEVGCGVGEVLNTLQAHVDPPARFWGYEISPQAHERSRTRETERLRFVLADFLKEEHRFYDLLLCLDVMEHVDDYLGFLRGLVPRSKHAIFHIPLDLSVSSVLRMNPILRAREEVGHLHYFSKDTALESLRYAGYDVLDWFYTASGIDQAKTLRSRLAAWPRRALVRIRPDFGVRLLGGFSLLVLATDSTQQHNEH